MSETILSGLAIFSMLNENDRNNLLYYSKTFCIMAKYIYFFKRNLYVEKAVLHKTMSYF